MVRTTCVLLALGLLWSIAVAEEPTKNPESIDIDSLTDLVVELKDEEGKPVAGAAVMVYAMRMEEKDGHGFWNYQKLGPPKPVLSNDDGKAVASYPAKVHYAPRTMTTRLVTFNIQHSDFVSKVVHFDLGPKTAEVTLKRGCEIQLSAVGENGDPVNDFGVMIAGPHAPQMWADGGNGTRRTSAVNDGIWQAMMVKPRPDGRTLFSTVLPLRVRPEQAVRIRNVRLRPGTSIRGKLSENVPRPVKDGYVVTVTVPKPANDAWQEDNPSLTWTQCEAIQADGSFALKSVPRRGEIQILAFCDGWLSKTTVPDQNFFVMGQIFPLVEQPEMELTVEMEPTGTLQVTVTQADGTPIDGGTLSSWPNQKYHMNGATVLGARFSSLTTIENQLVPLDQRKPAYSRDFDFLPFMNQPIKQGKAVLTGLPVGRSNSIMLQHPDWMLDSDNADEPNQLEVMLDSNEPKQVSVTAIPIKANP
jgi:hypothetical protein